MQALFLLFSEKFFGVGEIGDCFEIVYIKCKKILLCFVIFNQITLDFP